MTEQPVFISTRLGIDDTLELIRMSQSQCLIADENLVVDFGSLAATCKVRLLQVQDVFSEAWTNHAFALETMSWKEDDAVLEFENPLFFLHTSGTTGEYMLTSWTFRS